MPQEAGEIIFRAAAVDALSSYRGAVIIIDKINNKFETFYNSPDGLYASDVDGFDDGGLLISESSFALNSCYRFSLAFLRFFSNQNQRLPSLEHFFPFFFVHFHFEENKLMRWLKLWDSLMESINHSRDF